MNRALIVGIDHYDHEDDALHGCVNDAHAVKAVLDRHADGSINFDCRILTGTGPGNIVTRAELRDAMEQLFESPADIALLYFSGHGHIDPTGGYLLASDSRRGDEGLALNDVLIFANKSKAKNRVVLLDCCHSGIAGSAPTSQNLASLEEGMTVLTASDKDQYAMEENGRGVFTSLLVDALAGGAANLTGDITPGSVYSHIDQSLGAWEQRPIFKTNVREFVSLRKALPPISLSDLQRITEFFPGPADEFPLNPTFEPEARGRDPDAPEPIEENTEKFAVLQKYNRLNLLVPVRAPHMWHAAMHSESCKLTALGQHYWRLVKNDRI